MIDDTRYHKNYFIDPYLSEEGNGWLPQVFLIILNIIVKKRNRYTFTRNNKTNSC